MICNYYESSDWKTDKQRIFDLLNDLQELGDAPEKMMEELQKAMEREEAKEAKDAELKGKKEEEKKK